MLSKHFTLLVAVLCSLTCRTFAQNNQYFIPGVFPQSPNTAAQTKFGDYKVSMFTGLPDISIPLYTVKSGDLSLPITLSYHASGVKVTDVASWVGLGWSLSAGGSVSRRVVGQPDDIDGGYLNDNVARALHIDQKTADVMDFAYGIVKGSVDGRPDIFSYDFPGKSGKFFLNGNDHLFKPVLLPSAPLDIKYTRNYSSPNTITGFNIQDDHGNYYEFGKTNQETTHGGSQSQSFAPYTSSWMMEKMVSQNRKDTISFGFTSEYVYYPDESSDFSTLSDLVDNQRGGHFTWGYESGSVSVASTYVNSMMQSTINFKNGKVVFEKDAAFRQDFGGTSNNNFALNNIKVYNYNFSKKAMELQKTIVFFKSYFNVSSFDTKRLKLDSIQVLDRAGSIIQHYNFTYNESIALPSYYSKMKDYWGYYNGKNNTSLIPQATVPYQASVLTPLESIKIGDPNIANGRDADSLFMQAGVLTDIRYPTGGKTHFNYQTNQYIDNSNNTTILKLAGGLRVSSILTYESGNATPLVKTYKYLSARPNYILDNCYFSTSQRYEEYSVDGSQNSIYVTKVGSKNLRTFVSNSTRDLVPLDAAIVVYKDVDEYIGTPSANTGKISYSFYDYTDDLSIASSSGGPVVTDSYFYKRGQLNFKTNYLRKADGSYQPIHSESHNYSAFKDTSYLYVGVVASQHTVATGGGIANPIYASSFSPNDYDTNNFRLAFYLMPTGDNYETSSSTTDYDQNDPTKFRSSTVEYKYDNPKHQQISRVRTVDSRGTVHVTVNKYPADYLNGTTTNSQLLDTMLSRNMQAEVIEKWDSVKTVSTGANGIIGGQLNLFSPGILPYKISKLSVGSPITNFTPAKIVSGNIVGDSRYTQMISFDHYDYRNNLVQYGVPIVFGRNVSLAGRIEYTEEGSAIFSTPK